MATKLIKEEHFDTAINSDRRHHTQTLLCNYCEYFTKRKDYMLKHLAKEHKIELLK